MKLPLVFFQQQTASDIIRIHKYVRASVLIFDIKKLYSLLGSKLILMLQ